MIRSLLTRSLPPLLGVLVLGAPGTTAFAEQTASSAPPAAQSTAEPTTTGPSPSSSTTTAGAGSPTSTTPAGEGAPEATTQTTTSSTQSATEPAAVPHVRAQKPQAAGAPSAAHRHAKGSAGSGKGTGGSAPAPNSTHVRALSPSALTPLPPSALGSAISGVPNFFIANFAIPPFLLPIYQAAGKAYGIPWQVLAAINEVETDYGRDLSLSSAGAEGWMQFLPSSWAMYGVDANGDGYADPYNPADAIYAAARYLKAAGGARHIDAAIFSYNHSQSYVASVLLRAQLLGGTPASLLETIGSLTEARFPVHAQAHFSDGFPTVPVAGHSPRTVVGTTVYSRPRAPVIAVQDGTIAAIGVSPVLGRYVVLRDAYGNLYSYGQLGSVASLYPVLKPHRAASSIGSAPTAGGAHAAAGRVSLPPATAGVQPHSPFSAGAVLSGLAHGAAAELETLPASHGVATRRAAHRARRHSVAALAFRVGSEDVFLHPLVVGAKVIAGTVIGHLGAGAPEVTAVLPPPSSAPAGAAPAAVPTPAPVTEVQAHMLFQIRPAGVGAPEIDPKPLLDGWVQLQGSLIFRATGRHRFPAAPPAPTPSSASCGPLSSTGKPRPGSGSLADCRPGAAQIAGAPASTLTPGQWLTLVARLGQIPDPVVGAKPSPAAIPDHSSSAPASKGEGGGVHN
jgi:soluble lytic murein transglycosylase-like protein